jgi:hypothetical protein
MGKHYRLDAENDLSQEKLKVYMDSVHARVKVKDKNGNITLEKRPFCATKSGWFCCRPSMRQSDFAEYGMGMVIYFQFLKFMATMYCVMTVISIPSMVFYFSGNPTDRLSMSDLIPALSLGNIGQSETACASGIYEPSTSLVEITINCPFGKLDEVTSFGQVSFGQFV